MRVDYNDEAEMLEAIFIDGNYYLTERQLIRTALGRIPKHMVGGVLRWVEFGIDPGDFMRAVLTNDLYAAAGRADDQNARCLYDWVRLMHVLPSGCFGNEENYKAWRKAGGLRGMKLSTEEGTV